MPNTKFHLTEIHEAPHWTANNKYLLSGYRKGCHTFWKSFKTLFKHHNETFCIWSHLIGTIMFIVLCFYVPKIVDTLYEAKFERSQDQKLNIKSQDYQNLKKFILKLIFTKNEQNKWIKNETAKFDIEFVFCLQNIEQVFSESSFIFDTGFSIDKTSLLEKIYSYLGNKFDCKDVFNQIGQSKVIKILQELSNLEHYDILFLKWLQYYPIIVFLIGAILCFLFSTLFHLFAVVNPSVCKVLHKLDYAGISFLNFGSSFALYYYYFYCRPVAFWTFSSAIFIACVSVFIASMSDWIDDPKHHHFKGFMYGFLGISNLIPAFYMIYLITKASHENDNLPFNKDIIGFFSMGATYIVGLAFYITKFPERHFPYKFDFGIHSHTIWHFFVFAAALLTFFTIIWLFNNRLDHKCI